MKNNHKKVLNWVNQQRKNFGFKPLSSLPKGETASADSCPIANSLQVKGMDIGVYAENIELSYYVCPPKYVSDFINNFDEGKYPELIKE